MEENQDTVAFNPRLGCAWGFKISPGAEMASESLDEMIRNVQLAIDCFDGLFRPTEAIGTVHAFETDVKPLIALMADPLLNERFQLQSELGITFEQVRDAVYGIDIPNDSVRYLRLVHLPAGSTCIAFPEGEEWVDRGSDRFQRYLYGEPHDRRPGEDPLWIEVTHFEAMGQMQSMYEIEIQTSTDLWFADTETGRRNRTRLAKALTDLRDRVDPDDIDLYAEKRLSETDECTAGRRIIGPAYPGRTERPNVPTSTATSPGS